jgi:hypothetical protein
MSNQEPKKPRRPKSKRLNLNSKQQWERLIREIKKDQVPVNVLQYITVNLKDGTTVEIGITEMLDNGTDPALVQHLIESKLAALDDYIDDVDFHISVDIVAKLVQPITDNLLKNL